MSFHNDTTNQLSPNLRSVAPRVAALISYVITLIITLVLLATATPALAQTRYVATTGNDTGNDCTNPATPCEHIQYAMEQLDTGTPGTPGTIEVALGEYTEHIVIERDVTINGTLTETDTTIIQAHAEPDMADHSVIEIHDPHDLQITNVIIRHGVATGINDGGNGGGIFNKGAASFALTNVVLRNNLAVFGGGMYNDFGSSPQYDNVVFENNRANAEGGGLYNGTNSSPVFDNTTFENNFAGGNGGGMFNEGSNNSTLENVTFLQNRAVNYGGGMVVNNGTPAASMTSTQFVANEAENGAGLLLDTSSPTMTAVTFSGNVAENHGGGIMNVHSSPNITEAAFHENEAGSDGAGVYNEFGNVAITNATFLSNSAQRGGGMIGVNGATPVLVNVLFFANTAIDLGGALLNDGNSHASLTNVTIGGNEAGNDGAGNGGGIANANSSGSMLLNTIVWGNISGALGNELWNDGGSSTTLHYSLYGNDDGDVEGTITTANSITDDPVYVDLNSGALHLQESSPAKNTGDPNTNLALFPGGPTNPIDLDGNPRVFDDEIDMGAYEWQGSVADEATPDALTDVLSTPHPNPMRSAATFTVAVDSGQDIVVEVFDALGRRVQTLYEGVLASGMSETLTLNASALPAGVYVIRAQGENFTRTRRVTVVR